MAPGNNERHPGHTGTIPKTKVRNNCNVPQEAVTPTRRDMATNLTSLDWVPVSEYNTRANYNQSRKQTNNSSDHELTDLDNSVSFESGFGRFVPVRPQPRVLPLNVQNQNIASDTNDEGAGSSASGHSLHPYAHQMQNGLIPHSNHAAAAVMIVNPTTPNAVTGSMSQPFNAPNQNRSNLTRNVNPARNNFEGNSLLSNNNTTPPVSNARTATKTVNIMNNMYDQGQGGFNNINENNHIAHRESARTLGEAIVAACPDAAAVERRLGQIREYIRVTSSLVDTMRNSEDEQDVIVRPVSVQSNGSAYSENELWQNEIKNKMEMSSMRLAALKQQQKRLLKYQEEAKQQLDEMNRERQSQELHPATSHDNFANMQTQTFGGNFHHPNRMYAANQIGVATTLPHSSEAMHVQQNLSNIENDHGHAVHAVHNQDERFSHREANIASSEEAAGGGRDSDGEEDEGLLGERARLLQMKLRELQLKKQHMESLVTEFQKLQMATRAGSSRNTYSSSGEDSGAEESTRKCNNAGGGNIKNEDPFKLMEIKAIKTALQKTKDLMRSVENYEADHLSAHDETFQVPSHSNINDNKSEGGGSMGGWSNEGSVCRVRNTLPQRHKFTNEQHSLQQQQQQQQQSHEANIATLQELAQELRLETEKIMGERARIKDVVSNKELARKQKKVNEEVRPGPSGVSAPGPAERRQMQLRALLAEKQRELEALLNKENVLCSGPEPQKQKPDSRTGSIVNQSYTSEQEEPDSRSEQILLDSQNSQENENFRAGGDSALGNRSLNTVPSHLGSTYGSDSDSASRKQSNQRNRARRRQPQDRQVDDNNAPQVNNTSQNLRHEARPEASNVNMVPPSSSGDNPANMPYPHLQQPCWNSNKANQDMRNQFTQNSHSQTMDRLLGTPQMSFPPSVPFNMMMPYGMVGGCGCGCSFWGAWCWQQIVMQQREIHQLREQLNHLEERWRAENASHTLNNQVPPGNRANNYWDNFRSYSRQNLLSTNNKTNADGHLAVGPAHNPHPLVERSHNTLHHTSTSTSPSITPKRNTNASSSTQNATAQQSQTHNEEIPNRQGRRNISYERSLSFSSAPDVLNVNQNSEDAPTSLSRNIDDSNNTTNNVNINRQEGATNAFRNLNITNPIPEIIQSHSNNLNTTANSKKKSSSKLPAKNSTNRRNYTGLDYSQTSNINIASTSEAPNPNLASTSRKVHDKATSKLFDLLRENVYSEVTALIDVNESHPDFLIQLFRELQLISSDPLRQRVLQSIRTVLTQYASFIDGQRNENLHEENRPEGVSTTSNDANNYQDFNSLSSTMQIDNKIVRFLLLKSEEMFTPELMDSLASLILNATSDLRQSQQSKKKVLELLSKYEGMRVCDVSSDIIENLPVFISGNNEGQESSQLTSELSESSIFQDVAGSLNLFSSSDTQLHQMNACPYDMWSGHMHMDIEGNDDTSPLSSQEGKMDLINCSEMHNGDLAEADQTHDDEGDNAENHEEMGANAEALPDVVDTDEVTPTEAEVEWLGLDRVPTRLHMEESSEKQKD
ncbi:pericentriolar material 1 protein isoform X3 [Hyposmocoma kahamanoa]|uniref:pericentriolar material 1 protein isoform X3 n=1 Tax=Hyposmocoma kahamanoa TaxID=1477025 RepID=UPI000E6D8041|nr:pericentriolar material 1 protein isoform X3 [Hyposmocoma kahamanoa]